MNPAATASAAKRSAVLSALLGGCAGFAYTPVFGTAPLLVPTAVAAVTPVAVALASVRLLRMPWWSSAALSLLAGLTAACATLYPGTALAGIVPTPSAARRIGADVAGAPRELLGTILPARDDPRLLVLVFATVWAVSYAGAELALRCPSARARPALPALVCVCAVPLLHAGRGGPPPPVAFAALLLTGVLATVRGSGSGRFRRAALGVPVAAALALAAVGVTALLPGASRHALDLRDHVGRPPPVGVDGVSPLDRVSGWLADPARPMFSVAADGAQPGQLWRLTVFDRYDGVSWRPVRYLEPSGGRVPAASDAGPPTHRVTQRVTLDRLPGPWLPAADRPVSAARVGGIGGGIAVDPIGGVLASTDRFVPGTQYTVVSDTPVHDPDRTQYARPADDPEATLLPGRDAAGAPIPSLEALAGDAVAATAGSQFPYQQAIRLAEWLRASCRYDPGAVPGHGYRNLEYFLHTSKSGTSEQFAAAFAVMARTLELPTRVAVGFRGRAPGPDGVVRVTAGDALAWAEVHFDGLGWVPFFPTPAPGPVAEAMPPPGSAVPQTVVPAAPASGGSPPPDRPADRQDDRPEKDTRIGAAERAAAQSADVGQADTDIPWWAWAVGATAGAGVAAAAGLRVRAAAPGRARRRGPPAQRVFGAWAQANDLLVAAGMPAAGALTATEVAAYGRARLGGTVGDALTVLAGLYNRLAFAAGDERGRADGRMGFLAWRCVGVVDAAVRADRKQAARGRRTRRRFRRPRRRTGPKADAPSEPTPAR